MNIRKILFKLFKFEYNYCDSTDSDGLFVRFTDKCSNHCSFCFDKNCPHGKKNEDPIRLAEITNDTERKLITISGGEPCIDLQRLYKYIKNLDSDVHITLNTSLPKTCFDNKRLFYRIISHCDIVDISSHGTTNEEDEKIYGVKLGYDKQQFIANLAEMWPEKIYVSCVLTRSRFPEWRYVRYRLRHYYSLGVRNMYLNEYGNNKPFEKEKEFISINEILKTCKLPHDSYGSAFTNGCKVDLSKFIQTYFDEKVIVKCRRRCFRCGAGDDLTWRDVIKTFINKFTLHKIATPVLNEDGNITPWFISD